MTLPAVNGVRPQTRYSYGWQQAKYKNSSGALVSSGVPTTVLTSVSSCQTQTSCTGTADETKATPTYNNNLLPASVTVAAGNNSASRTTALGYDAQGNVTSVDGPLAGTSDTSNLTYDKGRELILAVTPDPDGAGSLPRLAQQVNYAASGLVTSVQEGTADAGGTAFTATRQTTFGYDSYGRQISVAAQAADGTTYGVTQASYDNRGRVQCQAVRMNSAAWGSLPASACTLQTTGSAGPDRIIKLTYDTAGRVTKSTSAYGTADTADDATSTYTNNGKVATLTDANTNQTTYAYDGFDRLKTVTYPGGSYEQYDYDTNGNVLSRRTRAGETLRFGYDVLNRLTSKIVPQRSGLSSTHTRDVYYGYDLQGHPLYARFDSASGEGLSFTFDALGQMTSTKQALDGTSRTLSYQYDAAGNRSRLTWPDSKWFEYDYDLLGRLKIVRNPLDARTLVLQQYDPDGTLSRSGKFIGAPDSYYTSDSVGRLAGLEIYGSGQSETNVEWNFTRNPASQILSQSRDNNAYAWPNAVNTSRSYAVNNLNQYLAAGAASFTYDANGNLASATSPDQTGNPQTTTYVYDVENRLVGRNDGSTGAALRYDPLGRLYEVIGTTGAVTTSSTRFLHDGDALVAEYSATGTLLRRYVHGGDRAADDPQIWFEGGGTATADARFLYADAQGSIVLKTDSDGNTAALGWASTPTTNTAFPPPPTRAGSSTPGRPGFPSLACTTTRPACTRPLSAGSCRPIPSDMPTG